MSSGDDERVSRLYHREQDKDSHRDHSSSRRRHDKDRDHSSRHHGDGERERERDRDRDRHHRDKERDREERKARERAEKERERERQRREERHTEKKSRRRDEFDEENEMSPATTSMESMIAYGDYHEGGMVSNDAAPTGRIMQGDESDSDYNDDPEGGSDDATELINPVKKTKAEKLVTADHSKIDYQPFRKNFYTEAKDIKEMPAEDAAAYRERLDLKVRGKGIPKPIKTWIQSGLTSKLLSTIKKLGFDKPMAIQAQALPVIMSGRDCIGVAKTGSGKTLAFVLPMLRHVKDQPPAAPGDGPIGLVMAPTRELVVQIYSDIKKFSKAFGVNCVAVYGGCAVAQQISELKRGAEIVVCTPGRMIDVLCTSAGKITNLRRVTFLVLDEADRMFDMGFEPQITRIVQNTRPDRQTVLFSATFPRQVETLARRLLAKPVEIQMGGRSVVNRDITQLVEVRPDGERFLRLLELLGEWSAKGKILVFVRAQDKCDSLLKELFQHGSPCLSLHGGKDQNDRESTLADFKSNVCSLLIATSIAARGLDVKDLELVVNYDVTNHYEDYVHRVGRTGRAGRKGCAVTFISDEEERYAPDLVKALELSGQAVPEDLKALADRFMAKVKQGTEKAHGTGYGGSGYKFDHEEDEARQSARRAQGREHGYEEDEPEPDSDHYEEEEDGGAAALAAPPPMAAIAAASNASQPALLPLPAAPNQQDIAAAAVNVQSVLARIQAQAAPEHYQAELEINDFPQHARWKVTRRETLAPIEEWTGAAVTTRGTFIPPGQIVAANERKLYLYIEGPNESSVSKAKAQLKSVVEDCANQALNLPAGKYSVI
uniref:RNA helicase n=1 Tax=Aegilops tauschii TaxID=37682 RepID=N1QTV3_AEGTA